MTDSPKTENKDVESIYSELYSIYSDGFQSLYGNNSDIYGRTDDYSGSRGYECFKSMALQYIVTEMTTSRITAFEAFELYKSRILKTDLAEAMELVHIDANGIW